MMRLDGRTALITGGTQGIGAEIAFSLARSGCSVVLHGLEENEASRTVAKQCLAVGAEFDVRVDCVFSDFSLPGTAGVETLLAAVEAAVGLEAISLLVNNAGTFCDQPYLEMDYATYSKTFQINVAAGYFLTQAFSRHWIKRKVPGRVLFTGSINGQLAESDHTAYDASKGAVHSLVRSLCVALGPHGIRVNGMAPGLVVTPLTASGLTDDPDGLRWMQLHTPNGQVPEAEVCGSTAVFLLSDEAQHIHGQTLLVDGGMSAWQQPDLPAKLRGHL